MTTMTDHPQPITRPSWCVRDILHEGTGTWHYAAPVTLQMSRDVGGRQVGPPAVLELELSYLELDEPLMPDEYSTPEIRVDGNDGSGNMVQLCLSVEDVEAVAGEMLRLSRTAQAQDSADGH